MENPFAVIQSIAEQRIGEAMERGEFDNLPGAGKPLNLENDANVPEELRMAHKILKNAGCLPPWLGDRKEAANILDIMDNCPDEQEKLRQMRRLEFLLHRMEAGRGALLEQNDEYYQKILSRLEKQRRQIGHKS